jgi:cation diffusion facilitator family transporter
MVVDRVYSGRIPVYNPITFVAVIFTLVINLYVSWYERRQGLRWRSDLLVADSQHTRSDVFVSAAVLTTLFTVAYGLWWPDLVVSGGIMLVIAWTALGIFRTNLGVLVDAAALDEKEVVRIVLEQPGILACHKVRSRGPSDHVNLDLHIHVPPQMSIEEAHLLTHEVEDRLREAFPQIQDVVIHTEPASTPPHLD